MDNEPPLSTHDRAWVEEALEEYFIFDVGAHAELVKKYNIDTLMSVIPTPTTKRATHCPSCRKRYVKGEVDLHVATALDEYCSRRQRRAQLLAHFLVDSAVGEILDDTRLLTNDEIQIGSVAIDYKPTASGVYFLLRKGVVVYVGQAKNVKARLRAHTADPEKDFDAYAWVRCEIEHLDTLEALYIMTLRPEQNKRHPSLYALLERAKTMPKNLVPPNPDLVAAVTELEATE